ncbi:permease [Angustibacter aerolatus]
MTSVTGTTSTGPTGSARGTRQGVAVLVVLVAAAAGLTWAKWLPYGERVRQLHGSRSWPGSDVLQRATGGSSWFERGWSFTAAYTGAVWKALVVALVVAALVDALVAPALWRRATGDGARGALRGGLLSLPTMMCTCCTAPVAVTMRRAGVPRAAALAFWLGNPVLNPAVLVFLALLAPWQWTAVRALLGVVLVLGAATVLGGVGDRAALRRAGRRGTTATSVQPLVIEPLRTAPPVPEVADRPAPVRVLRSFARLAVLLVPEYLVLVFLVGVLGPWLVPVLGSGGPSALVVVGCCVVGALLVLPTGGEIPVLLALAAAGASPWVLGALLVVLPTVSLPSAVMVGGAMGWRTTAATVGVVAAAGLVGGALLAAA